MDVIAGSSKVRQALVNTYPVVRLRERRYRHKFATTKGWRGLHYGVYESFKQALEALPKSTYSGYTLDNDWYLSRYQQLEVLDYPILFWLEKLIPSNRRLLDFGGHAGITYYKYSSYLQYPDDLEWVVCELPDVVKLGEKLRAKLGGKHLSFVTTLDASGNFDIFHSAGCIQYVEQPVTDFLAKMPAPPPHLILTKVPLYEMKTRVTLQNTGDSIDPCWLFNRDEFVASINQLGYRLQDSWFCPDRTITIPFHGEYNVPQMSGLYFQKK